MTNIKDYGYKTIMKFIDYDINTAYERVLKRELLTGRHTPVEIINERYNNLAKFIPLYKEIFDEFII